MMLMFLQCECVTLTVYTMNAGRDSQLVRARCGSRRNSGSTRGNRERVFCRVSRRWPLGGRTLCGRVLAAEAVDGARLWAHVCNAAAQRDAVRSNARSLLCVARGRRWRRLYVRSARAGRVAWDAWGFAGSRRGRLGGAHLLGACWLQWSSIFVNNVMQLIFWWYYLQIYFDHWLKL